MDRDVSVIGLGRVGLPLALSFADRGLSVVGIEKDQARLDGVRNGVMPFAENGGQEVMERVHASSRVTVSEHIADAAQARHIVITLGTPSFSHIEIDIFDIRMALDALLPVFRPGHSFILRSTIAPNTTDFVAGYIEKHRPDLRVGENIFVAHAPERIAAGKFFDEIDTLPQIIGGVG